MVNVEANGQQKILFVRIDEKLLTTDDREMLEDLIAAATNDALNLAKQAAAEQMSEITGGLNLPGMEEMMQQLNPNNTDITPSS
jgi:DNA-binding YbaB/EbfC family protein